MKRKTIENVVRKKLNAWLESITDEQLRKDVKANLLLSGGSIASMFLCKDVNDFDIYLKDVDVLTRLVKYYTESLGERVIVLNMKNRDAFIADMDGYEKRTNSFKIALETLKDGQVKIFFPKAADKGGVKIEREKVEEELFEVTFISPNAISLTGDIQIVTRFTGDAKAIHSTFDFIHATNYFTFNEGLVTNIPALESLLCKELRYQGSKYPLTSIVRSKKFVLRGWTISAGELLKIMYQISELDLTDPNVLEEQLIGVDVAYFHTVIEILRNDVKAGMKISTGYINEIIDKVFNSYDDGTDTD